MSASPTSHQPAERKVSDAPGLAKFTLGPFETNCYVVTPSTPHASPQNPTPCWVVDASFEPGEIIKFIRDKNLRPQALILTHAHADHIAGVNEVVSNFPGIPVWVHSAEEQWLNDPVLNLSAMYGMSITTPLASRLLAHGNTLELGADRWQVVHTPGHSPGGITLYHEPSRMAIVGDALFAGSIGRTDFPGSDHDTLERSIREQLYTLPDATVIHPGHGPVSTIGREKRSNPYVRPR